MGATHRHNYIEFGNERLLVRSYISNNACLMNPSVRGTGPMAYVTKSFMIFAIYALKSHSPFVAAVN